MGEGAPRGLLVEAVGGAARRAGLRAGDRIVVVNGRRARDVLDLEDAATGGALWLRVVRGGQELDLGVHVPPDGDHGIALTHGLGEPPRVCRNACRFCFVDQLPSGLRASLYVKDDDYRLSFLQGTFVTLTNLSPTDVERIVARRLSPLFVSLHAWDGAVRVALMGPAARPAARVLQRLSGGGVELHVQIVLCPGWNDGAVLAETVRRLAALPSVDDVGVVPVSLAVEGDLRRPTRADAVRVVEAVATWQDAFRPTLGRAFVHAADEFHLLAGRVPPPSDAPLQYENGIGMAAQLLAEAEEVAARQRAAGRGSVARADGARAVRLLGGVLVAPVLERACATLTAAGVACRPFIVANRLFGKHVTVTGLLGGKELLRALAAEPLAAGEWLLAPRALVPSGLGRTLDDVPEEELAAACDGRLVLADGLGAAFARLDR